jgi:hypothetical protein
MMELSIKKSVGSPRSVYRGDIADVHAAGPH